MGIAGLGMAVYGAVQSRRAADSGRRSERSVRFGDRAADSGVVSTGDGASITQLKGSASGDARVYQAARDQHIDERRVERQTVLPEEAVRPVAEVAAPAGLVNVPGRQLVFVGRGGELEELDAALRVSGGVVVAAVHGLGGVGKSTLAAQSGTIG